MILWTIQHKNAYDKMLLTGSLRADEGHLFCQDDFPSAYDWMVEQMRRRIGEPPEGVHFPVWAWYQWEGMRRRPDMRSHRRWGKKGQPIVLLTIDVPNDMVLLSDFDMWHCVLNDSYLPLAESDDIDNPTEEVKRKSWERIFNVDIITAYWDFPKWTQATFWELKREWVKKAEYFVSA